MINFTNKTAKFSRNKIAATAVAILLMLSMSASIAYLPSLQSAHAVVSSRTNAYVTCAPGIVGVGQYTTIVVWLDRYSPTNGGNVGQLLPGFLLNITQPINHHNHRAMDVFKCSCQ